MGWWLLAAIAASIVSSQIVGMLWYGPVLGKRWMKEVGMDKLTKKQLEEKQKEAIPGYIASALFGAAATALLWVMLVVWDILGQAMSDIAPAAAGALFGLLVWAVGYVPGTATSRFFEGQTWALWAIGAGYWGILAVLWGLYVGIFSTL